MKPFIEYLRVDFIKHALSHVKQETLPAGAKFPVAPDLIGTDPWEYLYGTTGTKITKALLDERFEHYYSKKGWTRDAYDELTKNWVGRTSTDCQGLPDSFLGTDVTANYNYVSWCTEKGAISEINRPFVIGDRCRVDDRTFRAYVEHDAAWNKRPITGANWTEYWEEVFYD